MEAISAIDNMTVNMPEQTTKTSQMAPAVPPLAREKTLVTRVNSQVRPRTMTYPTILKKRKRRCWSSCQYWRTGERWAGGTDDGL